MVLVFCNKKTRQKDAETQKYKWVMFVFDVVIVCSAFEESKTIDFGELTALMWSVRFHHRFHIFSLSLSLSPSHLSFAVYSFESVFKIIALFHFMISF